MSTKWWAILASLALALGLTSCDIDGFDTMSKVTEDFSHSYPLSDGATIEVFTKNGSVEILGWEKDTVEIRGTKYARSREELDRVKVDIAASPASLVIRSVFPDSRASGKGVRYVIRAPFKARVTTVDSSNGHIRVEEMAKVAKLDTSNGSITVRRSEGPLVADTSNGSIQISDTKGDLRLDSSNGRIEAEDVVGTVSADTSNGSIRVSLAEPAPGETLRFDTSNGSIEVTMKRYAANPMILDSSNGSITLRIPENINAMIAAETSNGGIQTDFPITVSGKITKNSLNTQLGSGGPAIKLDTTNSSVRLLRY
ncbi:MAG: DUF4097 family beta strand repeat-containing protein [Bryobacterales bacterium]|nr:DUF4097 family beta strand repeat-containing protein [Bryobacterales bacterium]